jgi:heme-degrading monooxygenase HmoA
VIVALIEYRLEPGREAHYAEVAAHLHAYIQGFDGFVSVERFESKTAPGKWLSVSYWRDATALKAWRADAEHRKGMAVGKGEIFAAYRIVIAEVARDYDFVRRRKDAPAS